MINLREEPVADLRDHASIPSIFESPSVFEVRPVSDGWELVERSLAVPFRKNYDHFENPLAWSHELGATESVLVSAFSRTQRVGGIIVAVAAPSLVAWPVQPGAAILWDLRVHPAHRRHALATLLVRAAQAWAMQRGCTDLCVETQNTNLAACKLYMHNGFVLREARHGAYTELPDDVQLIWRKRLDG